MTHADAMTGFILVASDNVGDADLIKGMLEVEFKNVRTSTVMDNAASDFDHQAPDVLVLAFDALDKAERYLLDLHRQSRMVHLQPHRNVTLCSKDQVKTAYAACRDGKFDDYIQFWPMTSDSSRLPMAVHMALREMAMQRDGGAAAKDFASQARRMGEMHEAFQDSMSQGEEHIEMTGRLVAQAEVRIGAAFDGLSQRLAHGDLAGMVEVRDSAKLAREFARMKSEEIHLPMLSVAQSIAPLSEWAKEFKHEMRPHMESARALATMAENIQPVVLVVDDDEFQRDLMRIILSAKNYQAVLAASGAEALAILRTTRADVILMDMMMPDMDGLQTTLRIKALPGCAQVPIIMITGKSDASVVRDTLKAGVSDFIVKPVERVSLLAKIARALRPAIPASVPT